MKTDTIAAIATALSPSGIGIIRISGDEAIETADRIFRSKSGKKIAEVDSHTIHYGFIYDGEEMIDEVDQVVFLGDYLDPYPHEGITFDDAIEELGSILDFKEKR